MAEQKARPRRRWPWILLAALLLLVLAAAVALRWFADPGRLTARLLGIAHERADIVVTLEGNASFRYWPGLRLHLPALQVRGGDAQLPMLSAQAMDVALPWSILRDDELVIERVELLAPIIHIDRVQHWLAQRSEPGADMPPFRMHLRIRNAALYRHDEAVLQGMDADVHASDALLDWFQNLDSARTPLIPPLQGDAQLAELQLGDTHIEGVRVTIGSADVGTSGQTSTNEDGKREQ